MYNTFCFYFFFLLFSSMRRKIGASSLRRMNPQGIVAMRSRAIFAPCLARHETCFGGWMIIKESSGLIFFYWFLRRLSLFIHFAFTSMCRLIERRSLVAQTSGGQAIFLLFWSQTLIHFLLLFSSAACSAGIHRGVQGGECGASSASSRSSCAPAAQPEHYERLRMN